MEPGFPSTMNMSGRKKLILSFSLSFRNTCRRLMRVPFSHPVLSVMFSSGPVPSAQLKIDSSKLAQNFMTYMCWVRTFFFNCVCMSAWRADTFVCVCGACVWDCAYHCIWVMVRGQLLRVILFLSGLYNFNSGHQFVQWVLLLSAVPSHIPLPPALGIPLTEIFRLLWYNIKSLTFSGWSE